MNKIFLIGNLTKDPDKNVYGEKTVTKFTLAVNEPHGETLFVDVKAWNVLGQNCAKYLAKGSKVAVVGRLNRYQYEVGGEKRHGYDITASDVEFIKTGENTATDPRQTPQTAKPERIDDLREATVEPDDMPF